MKQTLFSIAKSWTIKDSKVTSTKEILDWILERNENTEVDIKRITLDQCNPWFFDENNGHIRNENGSFFAILGAINGKVEQPIILQNEIGYLGIICQEINGVMHFLMQAKIEPGNINCVQISPTIQATKSNFTQKHGGKKPPYLDYFLNASKYEIIVDQIQSEQSSRFYKKRNRNIIIKVDEEIELLPNFKWMTLGQIKELMKHDNLVNMDTRTVISCIPFSHLKLDKNEEKELKNLFNNDNLFNSIFNENTNFEYPRIYQYINNQKMFNEEETKLVSLKELKNWNITPEGITCKNEYPYKVIYCDIQIEGREVKHWCQPLVEAIGIATFGLIMVKDNDKIKFLVKAKKELGSFDVLELGPTVQQEALGENDSDEISKMFWQKVNNKDNVIFDHLLSEEGGRFYHEQNRNVLLLVNKEELPELTENYFLLDFKTLNELVQINNILNIQLRNLLSLLEVGK